MLQFHVEMKIKKNCDRVNHMEKLIELLLQLSPSFGPVVRGEYIDPTADSWWCVRSEHGLLQEGFTSIFYKTI